MADSNLIPDESREQAIAYAELILGPAGINAEPGDIISRTVIPNQTSGAEHPFVELLREVGLSLDIQVISGPSENGRILLKPPEAQPLGVPTDPTYFQGGWPLAQTIAPIPTSGWIDEYFARDAGSAWTALYEVMRLGEGGAPAWKRRFKLLESVAANLQALDLGSLHFESPSGGTSLTVPLASGSKWTSPRAISQAGTMFTPNLPCEEVFATPDMARVEGVARTTRPMRWEEGAAPAGEVAFEFTPGQEGRVEASDPRLVAHLESMAGQLQLGEVALVDADSAAKRSGHAAFGDTVLDENAYSHLAIGPALPMAYEPGATGVNRSEEALHIDFVIGTDDLVVTGETKSGETVEILVAGRWGERVDPSDADGVEGER